MEIYTDFSESRKWPFSDNNIFYVKGYVVFAIRLHNPSLMGFMELEEKMDCWATTLFFGICAS